MAAPHAHVLPGTERGRDRMVRQRRGARLPLRPVELAVCLLVALDCLAINALVVAHAPRLSLDSLGPVALAYHDKHPRPLSIAIVIVILLLGTLLPRGGRVALLVFVGAAVANFASPVIWVQGVPDYFVFLGSDLIFNLADILMMVTLIVMMISMGKEVVRRASAPAA